MRIARVGRSVVCPAKIPALEGVSLVEVHYEGGQPPSEVATDLMGAGEGAAVLVVFGDAARLAHGNMSLPIEAAVVAVLSD